MTQPSPAGPGPDSPPPGPRIGTAPTAPAPIDPVEDPRPSNPTKWIALDDKPEGPTIPVPAPGGPSVPKVLAAA